MMACVEEVYQNNVFGQGGKKYTLLSDPTKNHHQMSYHCHALVYSYSWLYNLVLHLAMWVDTGSTEHECG